jgi:site-specific DNA-methyltransferase (adenine-specific)
MARKVVPENVLYYGDNIKILRNPKYFPDESVDLVYLDPPFNSAESYNAFFEERDGSLSASQFQAFTDTWVWDQRAAASFEWIVTEGPEAVSRRMQAFRMMFGTTDMLAYLSMMAPVLVELRRVLKPHGSVFLHCDSTANAHLRLLMDAVFGPENFRNEIIWHYYNKFQRGDIRQFAGGHDVILFYSREPGDAIRFKSIYEKRDKPVMQLVRKWDGKTKRIVNAKDKKGRVIYREVTERKIDSVWRLPYIVPASKEGLGYPTQKPESLLERIIVSASEEGDVVLDPFCGCGTAISVAERLHRRWRGIDITQLAITLIKNRLSTAFGADIRESFRVIGEPESLDDATVLAKDDPYQFQLWALGLVNARPREIKKGADKGIDGRIYFHDEREGGKTNQVIISVKGGHLKPEYVRELPGIVEREKAEIGVLISMEKPTKAMRSEAAAAGFYVSEWWGKFPRIQLITIEELLGGKKLEYPQVGKSERTFRAAPKAVKVKEEQQHLFGERDGRAEVVDLDDEIDVDEGETE